MIGIISVVITRNAGLVTRRRRFEDLHQNIHGRVKRVDMAVEVLRRPACSQLTDWPHIAPEEGVELTEGRHASAKVSIDVD